MDLSSLILPKEVFDNFTLTRLEESSEQIDLYLDELSIRPEGDDVYFSKGFTPYRSIQDYPLRGRVVYLHIRRRRWEEQSTGDIITRQFDIAHQGTHLSKEFAAFLKDADRLIEFEHQNHRGDVSC
jgi:transposase